MDIRDQRIQEAVDAYMEGDGQSIVYGCPRIGKCKIAIDIMKRMEVGSVLIAAPRKDIQHSWIGEFKKWSFKSMYKFTTFNSLKYHTDGDFDLVIIDEIHECSDNHLLEVAKFTDRGLCVLGLTGTMTGKTRNKILSSTEMATCWEYSIEQGVAEGILCDYKIFVHTVELSKTSDIPTIKGWKLSERGKFNNLKYIMNKSSNPLTRKIFELKMINMLKDSPTKMRYTRKLIEDNKNDRILVFCGVTKVADELGVPVYHSKKKEESIFLDFCKGVNYKHLACCKMMQAGITVKPIHKGIINYMSGSPEEGAQKICRFLGLEYGREDKKAEIHIISSTEPFETERIKTALSFFDNNKIKWL